MRKQANERLDEFKAAKAKVESELELALSGKSQLEAKLAFGGKGKDHLP